MVKGILESMFMIPTGIEGKYRKIDPKSESDLQESIKQSYRLAKGSDPFLTFESWFDEQEQLLVNMRYSPISSHDKRKITFYHQALNKYRLELQNPEKHKESGKYSTQNQRLYVLNELFPDFIRRVVNLSKKEKGTLLSIITNSNPDDCYRKLFTEKLSDLSKDNFDTDFIDRINTLKGKLTK